MTDALSAFGDPSSPLSVLSSPVGDPHTNTTSPMLASFNFDPTQDFCDALKLDAGLVNNFNTASSTPAFPPHLASSAAQADFGMTSSAPYSLPTTATMARNYDYAPQLATTIQDPGMSHFNVGSPLPAQMQPPEAAYWGQRQPGQYQQSSADDVSPPTLPNFLPDEPLILPSTNGFLVSSKGQAPNHGDSVFQHVPVTWESFFSFITNSSNTSHLPLQHPIRV